MKASIWKRSTRVPISPALLTDFEQYKRNVLRFETTVDMINVHLKTYLNLLRGTQCTQTGTVHDRVVGRLVQNRAFLVRRLQILLRAVRVSSLRSVSLFRAIADPRSD